MVYGCFPYKHTPHLEALTEAGMRGGVNERIEADVGVSEHVSGDLNGNADTVDGVKGQRFEGQNKRNGAPDVKQRKTLARLIVKARHEKKRKLDCSDHLVPRLIDSFTKIHVMMPGNTNLQ